jgi:ABC-type branched-subunit amino acid transport system ATPase component
MPLLDVWKLCKRFDGVAALDGFSTEVERKEIVGLIGPNGAGKSTFFNILTGFIAADSGKILFEGKDITGKSPERVARLGIARTFQDLRLIRQITVLENVMLAFQGQSGERLRNLFLRRNGWLTQERSLEEKAMGLLEYAGIAGKASDLAGEMSYGQQKLLSITCCLAADPELLLLDEPTAGLNPAVIDKMLEMIVRLPEQGKTVLLIEHNMDVVERLCGRAIFMNAGWKVVDGVVQDVLRDKRVMDAYVR